MQPDNQESQTNPVQPDTTPPQVFPAPQDPQNTTPTATPFVSPAPEQFGQPAYSAAMAAVTSQPVVPEKKKRVPTWLKLVIALIVLVVIGGVVALLMQNKKATTTQNNARTDFTASSNIQFIQSPLESFYSTDKYYPSDISSSTFDSLGIQLSPSTLLTPPAGAKYDYKATPSGCTTAAKNCKAYTLSATDTSTGANIITVKSTAGQTPTFKP